MANDEESTNQWTEDHSDDTVSRLCWIRILRCVWDVYVALRNNMEEDWVYHMMEWWCLLFIALALSTLLTGKKLGELKRVSLPTNYEFDRMKEDLTGFYGRRFCDSFWLLTSELKKKSGRYLIPLRFCYILFSSFFSLSHSTRNQQLMHYL